MFAYFIQRRRRIRYFVTFSWISHFIRDQTIKSLIARIISRPSGLFVISFYCGYSHFIPFLKQNPMCPSCWMITLSTSATNIPGSKPAHSCCSSSIRRNISMRRRRSALTLRCISSNSLYMRPAKMAKEKLTP